MTRQSVLVTGASGAVGAEILSQLRQIADLEVVGISRRGDRKTGVERCDLAEAMPSSLSRPWDIIIHAAASTRWNMTQQEAIVANIDTTRRIVEIVSPETHFVFISTAYAVGHGHRADTRNLSSFRNAYEWSKRQAEHFVEGHVQRLSIVRLPLVIGRATDGAISRFSGSYSLFQGLSTGLLAAIIGSPEARVELTPVDVSSDIIRRIAFGQPLGAVPCAVGANANAPDLSTVFSITLYEINCFRAERGVGPIEMPPMISRERWDRFFLPFCKDELSPLQLHAISLLSEFNNYTEQEKFYGANWEIESPIEALRRSIQYWARRNEDLALRNPREWA